MGTSLHRFRSSWKNSEVSRGSCLLNQCSVKEDLFDKYQCQSQQSPLLFRTCEQLAPAYDWKNDWALDARSILPPIQQVISAIAPRTREEAANQHLMKVEEQLQVSMKQFESMVASLTSDNAKHARVQLEQMEKTLAEKHNETSKILADKHQEVAARISRVEQISLELQSLIAEIKSDETLLQVQGRVEAKVKDLKKDIAEIHGHMEMLQMISVVCTALVIFVLVSNSPCLTFGRNRVTPGAKYKV